jgi:hypothetical protein
MYMETLGRDGFPLFKQGWMIKNRQILLGTKKHTQEQRHFVAAFTQDQLTLYAIQENKAQSSSTITGIHTLKAEAAPVVLAICKGDLTWHQANKKRWVDWGDSGSFFTSGRVRSGEPDWIPRAREALRPLLPALSQLLRRLRRLGFAFCQLR